MRTLTLKPIASSQTRPRASWRHAAENQSGGTMVEFAVAVLLLVTVSGAIVDCCRVIYADHYVGYAAAAGARYAMVRGSTWKNVNCSTPSTESCTASADNVRSMIKSIAPVGVSIGNNMSVATTWTGVNPDGANCKVGGQSNLPGCIVEVQVSYDFSYALPFMPRNSIHLTSTSGTVIAQ